MDSIYSSRFHGPSHDPYMCELRRVCFQGAVFYREKLHTLALRRREKKASQRLFRIATLTVKQAVLIQMHREAMKEQNHRR